MTCRDGLMVLTLRPQQVFLTDMKDFAEMNAEYEKWFSHKPARTCVAVYQLPKGVPVSNGPKSGHQLPQHRPDNQ